MKKGEIVEGKIETVDFPNKGNIEAGMGKILVKNTVPGQRVRVRIQKARKGKWEGRLLEVLEKSPLETREAACPVFGICGGCNYQTMAYGDQLSMKEEQVRRLLDQAAGEYNWDGMLESPSEWGYRNKMEFSFGDEEKDGPLMLGFHKRGSFHDIVDASRCVIAHKDYNQVISCARDYFKEQGIPFYRKLSHEGYLRHLLVRRATKTGEMLICLVTSSQQKLDLEPLVERWKDLKLEGSIVGILHIINDGLADVVKSDQISVLYGKDFFYEEILGLTFKISPFSFFQTNSLGAEVLYEKVREYAGETKDKLIFDLYSGTGTISMILAPVAKKVIGVEIVEEAVLAARENAIKNQLNNCEFIAGDVWKVIDDIEEKPDLIVLDPPRDGIHPKALQKIIDYGVKQIIYISCKPTSLARDLAVLIKQGYGVEKACAVDMFPQTANVETCVLLSHKKADSFIEVKMEYGDEDFSGRKPSKVTYKMIQGYVEQKYGFKVHTAYIAEVKRSLGLPMYDAPNAVEELKSPQKHPTEEKVKAIKDALKHYKVI